MTFKHQLRADNKDSTAMFRSPVPPKMVLRLSAEDSESERQQPLRLQITPDESEQSEDDDMQRETKTIEQLHRQRISQIASSVILVGSHQHNLTRDQARDIATTLFLAQQLQRTDVGFWLVLGSNVTMPANQLDMISRARLSAVVVKPDLTTLASTPFDHTDTESFSLTCRFVVGSAEIAGIPATKDRWPLVPSRPNATPIPWAAFNPAVHSEVPLLNRKLVVFENTPNRLLCGDSVVMTATRKTNFGLVGTVPAEQTSQSAVIAVSSLYFFRSTFPEMTAVDDRTYNMYNAPWFGGSVENTSVNVEINYSEQISPQRLQSAIDALQKNVFTKEQVNALMRAIIVDKKIIV